MLDKLYLRGFKSFAEPVTVDFSDSRITTIVGPNGSGKSNIVDAIRWVMGEQSPSALRGSRMSDIIFSGTDERQARSEAEVRIVLNNESGRLDIDEDQVTLSRLVDQEGRSDYYINGEASRLKDFQELLDDTGLNQEPYSVVGQNRVEAILGSSPEKLRGMFEEAAGISRHRRRKEEAERRLERTEQDLTRVEDLINELKTRLKPLEKEAEKAREYRKIYGRMKNLEASYLAATYRNNREKLEDLEEESLKHKEKNQEIGSRLEQFKDTREELKGEKEKLEDEREELADEIFQTKSRIQEIDNNLEILDEREKNLKERLKAVKRRLDETEGQKREQRQELEELRERQKKLKAELAGESQRQQEILAARDRLLREKSFVKARLEKDIKLSPPERREDLGQSMAVCRERIRTIEERIRSLERELESSEKKAQKLLQEIGELDPRLTALRRRYLQVKKIEVELAERLDNFRRKKDDLTGEMEKLRSDYARCRSRWQARRRVERKAEGYYRGVREVIKAELEGIIGPVARLIEAPAEYETALTVGLGSRMQQVVVEDTDAARKAIAYLRENESGRATFLPLDRIEGRAIFPGETGLAGFEGLTAAAHQVVDYPEYLEDIVHYLLGRVFIADNMKAAVKISRRADSGLKVVTLKGSMVNPGGSMTGGTRQQQKSHLLSRSREKRELARKAAALRQKMKEKRSEIEITEEKIADIAGFRREREELAAALKEKGEKIKAELRSCRQEHSGLKEKIEKLYQERLSLGSDRINLNTRLELIGARMERARTRQQRKENIRNTFKSRRDQLQQKQEEIDNLQQKTELKLAGYREKIASLSEQADEKAEKIEELDERLAGLKEELQELKESQDDIEARREKLKNKRKDSASSLQSCQKRQEELEKNLQEHRQNLSRLEKRIENFQQEKQEIEEKINSLKLKRGKIESQQERIRGRLKDKYELGVEKALKEFSSGQDCEDPRSEIKKLESRLKEMGEVNTGAIDEYERLSERCEFLEEERQDLQEARSSIKGVISSLEEEMGELFLTTFAEVNEEFEKIFPRLFGGGEAALQLTDRNNPLTTGVSIKARPPGKNLSSLSLLSGGEKALTAIALIFAFLEVEPSPVYVLDEIDSSLDEANLDMFAGYIRDYSRESQFITVTHRKRLMTAADTVYGVTMEEDGVSQLVSLQYDE